MEITKFSYTKETVKWIYKDEEQEYSSKNIIYANIDDQENFIYLTCGPDYQETHFHYLTFAGEEWLYYDKVSGKVIWGPEDHKVIIHLDNLIDVSPFMKDTIILILYKMHEKEYIAVYQISGEKRFIAEVPSPYKSVYLSSVNHVPTVVCEISGNDEYDRYLWHFKIDLNTGKLIKTNLAY